MRLGIALVAAGAAALAIAATLASGDAADSAAHTWPPFVLVSGLLLIGVVANEDGVFAWTADRLSGLPRRGPSLYVAAMGLVALITVLLNLDTSVAFLTPILVYLARARQLSEPRFLYGCVFMSNAASLLLPGSNLTNLLVIGSGGISGGVFLARMFMPWLASVLVTAIVVAVAFRGRPTDRVDHAQRLGRSPGVLSLVGIAIAIAAILFLSNAALPVLGIGLALVIVRLRQRRLSYAGLHDSIDFRSLGGVFLVAVALGTVARAWSYPGHLMAGQGKVATAIIGALGSVLVNNLPAAVLLGSQNPSHPQSLLFGLNIGPNLAVTGSLSALIWWQAARSVRAEPSARAYSAVGVVLVPLTLAAALAISSAPV